MHFMPMFRFKTDTPVDPVSLASDGPAGAIKLADVSHSVCESVE